MTVLTGAPRRALLIAHVGTSVGWLGAVTVYLVMAVAALTAGTETARALYDAMQVVGQGAVLPFALATLVVGVVQALTSRWGLLRHWWVVVKLLMTVLATLVLLAYGSTMRQLADAARESDPNGVLPSLSPVLHSALALLVLALALVLSVVKPRGLTKYGWRHARA